MLPLRKSDFHQLETLEETTRILAELCEAGEQFTVMGGGTDVVPATKMGLMKPDHLVYVAQLEELRGIHVKEGEGVIRIGGATSLDELATHELIRSHAPSLAQAASQVAHPQIRNMGTIAGNICLDTRCVYVNKDHFWRGALGHCLKVDGTECHVVPGGQKCVAAHSADTPPVLLTLNASVELASHGGNRSVPMEDFYKGDGIEPTFRRPDEVVTAVEVPIDPNGSHHSAFRKLRHRTAIDFPLLTTAVAIETAENGTIDSLNICVSGLVARPRSVSRMKTDVEGRRLDDELIREIAAEVAKRNKALPSRTVDLEWLQEMVGVLTKRCLDECRRPT